MKTFQSKHGPFRERPYYSREDVERLCARELRDIGLLPLVPGPVRIERFIELRFKVSPTYEELPTGVLGWTRFGRAGVEAIIVARDLADDPSVVAGRRVSSTLAHEAGHGLLHGHLFALDLDMASLFPGPSDVDHTRILCRDDSTSAGQRRGYDGRWWELQANIAMATLLLPPSLVEICIAPFVEVSGLGRPTLHRNNRESAARAVAETFEVNLKVARLRLGELFPDVDGVQLTF